jgi:hypothetical protein
MFFKLFLINYLPKYFCLKLNINFIYILNIKYYNIFIYFLLSLFIQQIKKKKIFWENLMEFLKGLLGGKSDNSLKENIQQKLEIEILNIEFPKGEAFEVLQKYQESLKQNKEVNF